MSRTRARCHNLGLSKSIVFIEIIFDDEFTTLLVGIDAETDFTDGIQDHFDDKIEILDCTLRDGSYANAFQFSARDTRHVCAALEKAAGFIHEKLGGKAKAV